MILTQYDESLFLLGLFTLKLGKQKITKQNFGSFQITLLPNNNFPFIRMLPLVKISKFHRAMI